MEPNPYVPADETPYPVTVIPTGAGAVDYSTPVKCPDCQVWWRGREHRCHVLATQAGTSPAPLPRPRERQPAAQDPASITVISTQAPDWAQPHATDVLTNPSDAIEAESGGDRDIRGRSATVTNPDDGTACVLGGGWVPGPVR